MYNTALLTNAVLLCLIANVWSGTGSKPLKGSLIHMNNARPHDFWRAQKCIEGLEFECVLHQVYSPDLAPSDFFRFGYIKGKLSDSNCESLADLLNAMTEIFAGAD
jgi:hypothetical protein